MTEAKEHWEHIHATKGDAVSWHQEASTFSLRMIRACGLPPGASVLDVGAGASVLVDQLLGEGFEPALLDISQAALDRVRTRLGEAAARVRFLCGNVAEAALPDGAFDLWHDRAVFHFLVSAEGRAGYLANLHRALRPGGFVVMAGFAPDGPEKCSGLPVCRYDAEGFGAQLGPAFELLESERELHATPFGTTQAFQYARFRRR